MTRFSSEVLDFKSDNQESGALAPKVKLANYGLKGREQLQLFFFPNWLLKLSWSSFLRRKGEGFSRENGKFSCGPFSLNCS